MTLVDKVLPEFAAWAKACFDEHDTGVITTHCANRDVLTLLLPEFRLYIVKNNGVELFRSNELDEALLHYIGQSPIASTAHYYRNGQSVGSFDMRDALFRNASS